MSDRTESGDEGSGESRSGGDRTESGDEVPDESRPGDWG